MIQFRIWLIIFAGILIIVHLATIDYSNMSCLQNDGNYVGILTMILIIISMILSNRYERRKRDKEN